MRTFRVRGILRSAGPGTWTVLRLSRRSSAQLGSRGKARVRGELRGHTFESTAVPNGDGTHSLLITKPIQASAGVGPGDSVEVELEVIPSGRSIALPRELRRALAATKDARKIFDALAPSHRRAWAEYIDGAKLPATRTQRASRAVVRIAAGQRNPKA
ncbi:MAG: YdeI/OmpD-associated family protein [Thermoplasmata archaeon]|nr:YdeI/OmpD-associated family protein [Thermoplasmata archaeon]